MLWLTVAQVMAAAAMGAVVGLERELDAQRAGLRTHMLVALGSALFTVAGVETLHTDPTRIAAQVVTGVGFLGGGAILREGTSVHGLTTAASLWVTAAIGVAVGLREWMPAIVASLLTVVVLRLLKMVRTEFWLRRTAIEVAVKLTADSRPDRIEEQIANRLPGARTTRVECAAGTWAIVLAARPRADETLTAIGERLMEIDGIRTVEIAR